MKASKQDLQVVVDMPAGTIRQARWGDMTIEVGEVRQDIDVAPLFEGLPDNRCQCPHWGYVLKGHMHFRYVDHEEVYSKGDYYYVPPVHTTLLEAGSEYVEFSPTDKLSKTTEVVERNMIAQH